MLIMSNTSKKKLLKTGKLYHSFTEMVLDTYEPEAAKEFLKYLAEEKEATKLAFQLSLIRLKNGLTYKQMGKLIGKSSKWVEKVEESKDKDLTIGQIKTYLSAFDMDIEIKVK